MELKQYIKKALNGDVVPSVEMGGLSEEYENAIQQLAFQMMVEFSQIGEYDKEKVNHIQVKCVNLLDSQHGFSGAQVGAATNLACVFWRQGVEKAIEMMRESDPSRIIKVKNCMVYNELTT